jgi:hypothetical protein
VAAAVAVAVGAADECLEHLLDRVEVLDGAAADGAEDFDVLRLAAEHLGGLGANFEHLARVPVDGDARRLVEDDAAVGRENESVNRAEVDGQIVRKDTAQDVHSSPTCSNASLVDVIRRGHLRPGKSRSTETHAHNRRFSKNGPAPRVSFSDEQARGKLHARAEGER